MNRIRTIAFVVAVVAVVSWRSLPSFAQAPDPADAFFNDGVLHEIRLSVNTRDLQVLKDHWLDKTYYPADFRWNNQVVRNVGIRSRGGGSRRPNKLSLRVDMNRYTDGQTFLGLRSFILRNTSQDPSYMRERLAMGFFRRLGIPAVREAHARVFINNQYAGLFTIVESPDTDYLRKSLGENTGRLYEFHFDNDTFLAGQGAFTFRFLGSNPSLYVPSPFQPQTFEDDPQGDVIARWMQAISDLGNPDWRGGVSAFLDLPGFIRHLAIENFLAEEDGLTGDYGPNNFYLYRFANTTRFQFLPWDKSNAFYDVFFSIFRNIRNGPDELRNVLVLRALDEPDLLQLYLDTMLECAAAAEGTPDTPGFLEAEVARISDQIRLAAREDTFIFTPDEFEQAVADLAAFARDRSRLVRAQVAAARGQ
jgi:spore coat protein CotH